MKNFLEKIIETKKMELKQKQKIKFCPCERRDFKSAISRGRKPAVIAEIKKASPSKGIFRRSVNAGSLARIYEESGASAISVVTDKKYFKGSLDFIREAKEKVKLPVLRKDFIIDSYQIYESYAAGADAVLLIAAILTKEQLGLFVKIAKNFGMDSLVEVHGKDELEKTLSSGADIIGINNRDLKTFKIDLKTTGKLIKKIPHDKIVVSESGIENEKDFRYVKSLGVDAVLIGGALMKSKNIENKFKSIFGEVQEKIC